MSRRHADPVDVHRQDGTPQQFRWRNRCYVVAAVLAHWTESGSWWCTAAAGSITCGEPVPSGADGGALVLGPIPAAPRWAERAWGEPAPEVGAAIGPSGVDDGEREYWRVEAATGRRAGTGVYDLCFDWSRGGWTVARVLD